jgi:gamma-glutamylcyclotransferase (GGCT)/AIG2-like uncharacterized protein YtfP
MKYKGFKYYLAYGSNLNIEQMKKRCPTAIKLGGAMLNGYELIFNRVASIKESEKSAVPVGLWLIDEACEVALDGYEGYPHLYRKEYVKFVLKGQTVKGMFYVMNRDRVALPSDIYYSTIEKGYSDFNLDIKHLKNAVEKTRKQVSDIQNKITFIKGWCPYGNWSEDIRFKAK